MTTEHHQCRSHFWENIFKLTVLIALFLISIWVVDLLNLCKTAINKHQNLLQENLSTLKLLRQDLDEIRFANSKVPEPR